MNKDEKEIADLQRIKEHYRVTTDKALLISLYNDLVRLKKRVDSICDNSQAKMISRVREALKNAAENGYDHIGLSSGEIAADLMKYDSSFENESIADIISAIFIVKMNGV